MAELLKSSHWESLGENVNDHVLSGTVLDLQYILHDCLLCEMIAYVDVFCIGMELVILSYCNG